MQERAFYTESCSATVRFPALQPFDSCRRDQAARLTWPLAKATSVFSLWGWGSAAVVQLQLVRRKQAFDPCTTAERKPMSFEKIGVSIEPHLTAVLPIARFPPSLPANVDYRASRQLHLTSSRARPQTRLKVAPDLRRHDAAMLPTTSIRYIWGFQRLG